MFHIIKFLSEKFYWIILIAVVLVKAFFSYLAFVIIPALLMLLHSIGPFSIGAVGVLFLIYVLWAIWTKGVGRKVLMVFISILVSCVVAVMVPDYPAIESDYCIEDGDCAEGREIVRDGKAIIINKQSCIEHNWAWDEKRRECKVRY